ncbi:MAG: tRNA (guanosine(46)-N7)-methyltransferase TrmB [Rhizobiales bacterium]|nr:tRNA (guanosine(46)-N7)-methyltransferase TrmB [Hyphomicrobiales bacterium]
MERRDALYGRRKGKKLSPRRTGLMATLYPALALDLAKPAPADLRTLFPVPVKAVRLEIGFGGGEHMLANAAAFPDIGFIGVEPFVNGMAKALATIEETGARNVRLHDGDAALLLDWLPPESLAGVDLLYPDPWPKKRHFKRRFVSDGNLARIARALAPGGLFRVASDIESYIDWTLLHVLPRDDFAWTATRADDWRKPFPGWPGTRYEQKAVAAGRVPAYLVFKRG